MIYNTAGESTMPGANDILNVLNEQRRMLQMPLSVLSSRAGTSVATVTRILAGQGGASFATVAKIADTLGVELGERRQSESSVRSKGPLPWKAKR